MTKLKKTEGPTWIHHSKTSKTAIQCCSLIYDDALKSHLNVTYMCDALRDLVYLCNLKKVKNTHSGVLLFTFTKVAGY